ncbi:hypothetical protein TVAG_432920 [Trichomonas vaginalis G3]|uniref:Uncharacterized protein n=1 Tax=Trichomonas vaginalis (strain ATCC PRA-98 / G3) TaxID=412133 RepID=A2DIT3_TRIV3|nr:hypothetical protein TVAGG3_0562250 [Trichomonas vaginalis G3]EAY19696.1 hypothetical protein TVAG_432920 [Trichomonas vaginalis G3]KAI5521284.1 hypothetical protein TVAGG3_0562250 [Trichomonas vaginalis G3]|eukprot:XP_001580682.1 hypothetical protein [Trichomonas vaginalis G3]
MATSILIGINRKRESFFQLKDPMVINSTYLSSPTIHYYTALLVGLNAPFHDISFAISFLNTFASAVSLFHLAGYYHKYQAYAALFVLLNGGWAFIRNFTVRNDHVDLVHNVGREYHVPMYQIFSQFILFSKTYSFAFPMAIFSLILLHKFANTNEQFENYMVAGLLIALCPSFMVSASLAIYSLCQLYSVIFAGPFFISFVFKYFYSSLRSQPIWREYQMNGIFFAQIVSWIDALGPLSFMIILAPLFMTNPDIIHKYVSMLCSMCFISFFRNGAFLYDNSAAIAFTILPILTNITFGAFGKSVKKLKEKSRGILIGSFSLLVILSILGGVMSNRRQLSAFEPCTDQEALTASRWVATHVPINETVLTIQIPFNPISFSAGRQIFSSLPYNIWMRGEDFATPTAVLRQIDLLGGAPNLMRKYHMKYLLEFVPVPLVSRNRELLDQFMIVESSDRWSLLKLRQS